MNWLLVYVFSGAQVTSRDIGGIQMEVVKFKYYFKNEYYKKKFILEKKKVNDVNNSTFRKVKMSCFCKLTIRFE